MSVRPALITTVHDPERRLLQSLQRSSGALAAYGAVYAFVTEVTDLRVIEILQEAGVQIETGPTGVPGGGQRTALAAAFEAGHEEILACDFDRWPHWHTTYPRELLNLPKRISHEHANAWYVCLGRTERAVATHPAAQVLPEAATNRALSAVAGKQLDATAGAAWIRREGAKLIVDGSTATTKATDLEWPGLVLRADAMRVEGTLLEGLEFETADSYQDEIAGLGSLEAWIRETYDRPDILHDRLQLAADSIATLIDVLGITRIDR